MYEIKGIMLSSSRWKWRGHCVQVGLILDHGLFIQKDRREGRLLEYRCRWVGICEGGRVWNFSSVISTFIIKWESKLSAESEEERECNRRLKRGGRA